MKSPSLVEFSLQYAVGSHWNFLSRRMNETVVLLKYYYANNTQYWEAIIVEL